MNLQLSFVVVMHGDREEGGVVMSKLRNMPFWAALMASSAIVTSTAAAE
jgi:hypothetical protein